jgi:phosphoribosyl 1,2-cyclic phosphodiesterase
MRVRFWGVRGSLPAPLLSSELKSKFTAILERMTPLDLESPESRNRFLSELPPWLFGTVGGNTPCVSFDGGASKECLVFDCGSGIRELGNAMIKKKTSPNCYHIFLSHLHWDHIHGLPIFSPAYNPAVELHFYSPLKEMEEALKKQMGPPCFPVPMDIMESKKHFHVLTGPVTVGGCTISYRKMNHPGNSYSYKVTKGRRRFIYATDTELSIDDFLKNDENTAFFNRADMIILDSQYTLGEAIEKYNWGHSAFSLGADFAANWGIKHLVLFHHDPSYDDRKLFNILQSARWYVEYLDIKDIKISLAMEESEIIL